MSETLGAAVDRLAAVVRARTGADPAASYTARLLADPRLAAKKLAEEAAEVLIAALAEDGERLAAEAGDLLYHLLALLAARGVDPAAVAAVLRGREGRSGLEEKAARRDP